jgi:hypothetical protein
VTSGTINPVCLVSRPHTEKQRQNSSVIVSTPSRAHPCGNIGEKPYRTCVKQKMQDGKNSLNSKTGVVIAPSEEKPLSRKILTGINDIDHRCERMVYQKFTIPQKLITSLNCNKIKALSKSINSLKRGYSPFHRFHSILKRIKNCPIHILRKISNILVGGLVYSNFSVGIPLTERIRLVKRPTLNLCKILVLRLPFWGSSYTKHEILNIVCLLKK